MLGDADVPQRLRKGLAFAQKTGAERILIEKSALQRVIRISQADDPLAAVAHEHAVKCMKGLVEHIV